MSSPDLPCPGRRGAAEWTALAVIVAVGLALRLDQLGVGYFNMHAARDCFRSLAMIHGESFETTGPEMIFGGRTLGWYYYLHLAVPLVFSPSPIAINIWTGLLSTVAIVLLHVTCRRLFGVSVGLIAAALFAAFPPHFPMLRMMWNPSHLAVFNIAAFLFLMLWRVEGRRWAFGAFLIAWGLAFQIHFSSYVYLLALFVLLPWRCSVRPGWKPVLIAVVVLSPFWGAYLVREIANGWLHLWSIMTAHNNYLQLSVFDLSEVGLNSGTLPQALNHLRLNLHEPPFPPRYILPFDRFVEVLEMGPIRWLYFAYSVELSTWLNVVFFIIGLMAALLVLAGRPVRMANAMREMFVHPERARHVSAALIAWLVGSFIILLIMGEGAPGNPRPTPPRYFAIWYPIQFIVIALGLRATAHGLWALFPWRRRPIVRPLWKQPIGIAGVVFVGALFISQALFVHHYLSTCTRDGTSFYYFSRRDRPVRNIGDKVEMARVLVEERGLTLSGFRERFSTSRIYSDMIDEECFDYELRAQDGFTTGADASPDVRWHLADAWQGNPLPLNAVEILHDDTVGRLRAFTFTISSPEFVIPREVLENGYIW